MATKKTKKSHAHRPKVSHAQSKKRTSNAGKLHLTPGRLAALIGGKKKTGGKKKYARAGNPFSFFGGAARPKTVLKAAVGVLAGVAITKAVVPMLPASWTQSNVGATLSTLGVALAAWYAASMIDAEFGSSVGLGGVAEAGSTALNAFLPAVGSHVSLGDLIAGKFAIPENPVMRGNPAVSISSGRPGSFAYPSAYRVGAA